MNALVDPANCAKCFISEADKQATPKGTPVKNLLTDKKVLGGGNNKACVMIVGDAPIMEDYYQQVPLHIYGL